MLEAKGRSIDQPEEVDKLAVVLTEVGMQFMDGALVALDGGIGGRLYAQIDLLNNLGL
jgi:hypothetical protein